LLSVGLTARKNTERIIEAYEKINVETKLKLVILGHPYMDFHPPRGVLTVGHIPLGELADFYSGAEALVYPSLYEGFGLPILEAMVCRTPVVTSNIGSMTEVGEDAAILVDPYNVNSIADGVLEAISNKEKYVKLGRKRVKQFSWERNAKETLKVYKEALGA
jgi:glycosyltransferase involved in cell wall biosynthesis